LNNYIVGEYKGKPNGRDLQKGSMIKFLLLEQTDDKAVVAMTIVDSTGKGFDTYLHFEKDTIWKMSAFRALAMTGMIEGAKKELEKMTPQQVDELINAARKKKDKYALFSSRADYEFQLGNATLILQLDEHIISHFLANKVAFERIKDLAYKELESGKVEEEGSVKLIEHLRPEYQKLFVSSVSYGGYQLGNCLNFLIGGMIDNTVGYIHVKDKKDMPKMSSNRIIMLREIGEGWYIYKTT